MEPSPASSDQAARLYAFLLSLYPPAFHQAFGAQMLRTFRDQYDAYVRGGQSGLTFWTAIVQDLAASLPREHLAALKEHIVRMPKLIFGITVVLALLVSSVVLLPGNASDWFVIPFALCLFALVGLGGYVLWHTNSDVSADSTGNAPPLKSEILSAGQSRRLRVAVSTILWVFPVAFLGYIWLLSNLDDLLGPATTAQASAPFQTLTGLGNLLLNLSIYILLAAALILAVSLARNAPQGNGRLLYWVPLLLAAITLFFAPFALGCDLSRLFGVEPLCGSLPFTDEQFFPMLFVTLFVLAVAVAQGPINPRTLRIVFVPLAFVTLTLVVQVIHLAAWASTIWNVPQSMVTRLAFSTDRAVWSVGDWHLELVLGLTLIFFLILAAVLATARGARIWFTTPAPN